MTNANTLERWRPHPLVFIYCALAAVLLGIACFWGIALLVARWYQPESAVKAALAGTVLFVAVLLLSLRRCSTPALPAFRGLLLITGYMTIGVGGFFLLFVIPAVVFAIVSIIAIALVSLFRKDTAYARNQFRQLLEFYRKHRMYQ
jgi:thiamine transporter ThiT